jgi:hypothetical protein
MNLKEIQILTKVGGHNMSHLPSEMTTDYTFGQGAMCWGPIPLSEVTEEIMHDVEGSASPRPMTLDEAIEVDQENICYFNRSDADKLKEAIASLEVHRTLRNWGWKGLIPATTAHCEQIVKQLNQKCELYQFCSYKLRLEEAKSLGVGEDGKIYVSSLNPREEQVHNG